MESEVIIAALVACIPLSLYLFNRYMKMKAADSPGGDNVTWDEIVETFNDPVFWEHIEEVKNATEDEENGG